MSRRKPSAVRNSGWTNPASYALVTTHSEDQRLTSVGGFVGGQDQDNVNFLCNVLDSFEESQNDNDNDNNFCCKDLNSDDHFVNLVEETEDEVSEDDDDDPQYKLFLSHVKGNGKSFTFEMKDEDGICKRIEYHKEEPICGRHYRNKNRNKNRNKDDVEEDDIYQILDYPETNDLMEKLMALLRKPFDEQEYNTLWHEVTLKRYKLRHKELPDCGEESVRTKIKTKSYLRKHKTFRRAIEAVPEDKFKKLNILRGFAFWLKHMPYGGEFKPWEDATCLAVLPGTQ